MDNRTKNNMCICFKGEVDAEELMSILPEDYMGYVVIDGDVYYNEKRDISLSGSLFVMGNIKARESKIFIDGDLYCETDIVAKEIISTGNVAIRGDNKNLYAVTALGNIFLRPIMFDKRVGHINQVFINNTGDYLW